MRVLACFLPTHLRKSPTCPCAASWLELLWQRVEATPAAFCRPATKASQSFHIIGCDMRENDPPLHYFLSGKKGVC